MGRQPKLLPFPSGSRRIEENYTSDLLFPGRQVSLPWVVGDAPTSPPTTTSPDTEPLVTSLSVVSPPITIPSVTSQAPVVPTDAGEAIAVDPTLGGPVMDWVTSRGVRYEARRTHEIRLAQDSMNDEEVVLYDRLWKQTALGSFRILALPNKDHGKIFQGGYDILAEILGRNEKTVRTSILPGFTAKFILSKRESYKCGPGHAPVAAVYELFSYVHILDRQRQAGYTRAVRNGRLVVLVRFDGQGVVGDQYTSDPNTTPSDAPTFESPTSNRDLNVGDAPTTLLIRDIASALNNSSHDVVVLDDRFAGRTPRPSRAVLAEIVALSRGLVPDVTAGEIGDVLESVLTQLGRDPNVRSPVAVARTSWLSYFSSEEVQRRRKPVGSAESLAYDPDPTVLADPDAPENLKTDYRLRLKQGSGH